MRYFIIKRRNSILFVTLVLFQMMFPAKASEYGIFRFDFGPQESSSISDYIVLSEKSLYSKKQGYGLMSDGSLSVIYDNSILLNNIEKDGIVSDASIQFRVDIPPGDYWIELLLPAGERSTWRGRIVLNEKKLVSEIRQYEKNVEGDTPPVSWISAMQFTNEQSFLKIEIEAENQPTALAGIRLFPLDIGPLRLQDGLLVMTEQMNAPNSEFIVELLNKGAVKEVPRLIDAIPEDTYGYEKAIFLTALAGRLETEHTRPLLEWANKLFENSPGETTSAALHKHLIDQYLQADSYYKMAGWDWAKKLTDESIFPRMDLAARIMECGTRLSEHPLQHRYSWELGRISFMTWVEEHTDFTHTTAMEQFQYLKPFYPDFRLLKVYLGENIITINESLEIVDPNAPEWAVKSAEALKQINDLIRYWVVFRQAPNGEFGGKYDDDVEMLRWWFISRLASDNQTTLVGMRKLVDGIWDSGWITNGFSTKLRDVEHSSEPISDSQPMMVGLDFGNPKYVERCMESMKGIRDIWTGINDYGHRHFKSSWYSYKEIDSSPPKDCDVPMNTRTVRALRWVAWYNHHPFAIEFMKEWGDAWLEDCQRTDNGKPYGIVPSAIRYEDDRIGGHADNWHHPGMFWSYYDFRGGIRIMQQMLATYTLTGDNKYLEPIEVALELVRKYQTLDTQNAETGSEAWVAGMLKNSGGFGSVTEQWRIITGNSSYDDVLMSSGSDYLKFRISGNKNYIVSGSQRIIDGIISGRELVSTEGYYTDRIEIGNIHNSDVWASSHLESVYLGSTLDEGFHPFYHISWTGFSDDFAALVLESNSKELKILVYNFLDQSQQGKLNLWYLNPGKYTMKQGGDENEDDIIDNEDLDTSFVLNQRFGSLEISIPSRQLQVISIQQEKSLPISTSLCDLAVANDEIIISTQDNRSTISISVPVHNIGNARAENVEVVAYVGDRQIAEYSILEIPAPLSLESEIVRIDFELKTAEVQDEEISIIVNPKGIINEITLTNNTVFYKFK